MSRCESFLSLAVLAGALLSCSTSSRPADDAGPADGGDAGDTDPGIPGWELAWAVRAGTNGPEGCVQIAALEGGALLAGGGVDGPADFGEGTANEISTGYHGGEHDAFLARYAPDGTPEWVAIAGGPGLDQAWGLAALADGSAFLAGRFEQDAVFGQGEPEETVLSSHGHWDLFVARFSPAGELEWAAGAGGPKADYAYAVAALADGSALVTGQFQETVVFGEGTAGETGLASGGSRDVYAAKYGPEGDLCWARRILTGPKRDEGQAAAAGADGSFFVAGTYRETVVVGEGEDHETVLVSQGEAESVFVARWGPDESLDWVASLAVLPDNEWDGPTSWAWGVEPDGAGGCFATGGFMMTMVAGQGEPGETVLEAGEQHGLFVVRLDATGALAWAVSAGGADEADGTGVMGRDLALGPTGLLALAGEYDGETILGHGEGAVALPFEGYDDDALFAAIDAATGAPFWGFGRGGLREDRAGGVSAWGEDSLFYCGYFTGEAEFGTAAEDAVTLTAAGGTYDSDIFVLRFDRTDPPD